MKRFLLFYGDVYYPNGGWDDFRGSFATLEKAQQAWEKRQDYMTGVWHHIVDSESSQVVEAEG